MTALAALSLSACGAEEPAEEADAEPAGASLDDQDTVFWNGQEYVYNDHLSNFLFLGIDTRQKQETAKGQADAGQADALFLLSWDRATGRITVASIPRDTMTMIEFFGPEGNSLGKDTDHISLSYAYGDGGRESCLLTKEAVSELFYGVPIQGYCAMDLDGISVLTESVGGVTVTVPNDSLSEAWPEFQEGEQATLDGENTEIFVRYRDTEVSQSAMDRLERQEAFLEAYGDRLRELYSEDPGVVTELYGAMQPYLVTNMGNDQFVKLCGAAQDETAVSVWTVPGEGVEGVSYDEYWVDDDALYEQIIRNFYEEAS